MSYSSYYRLPGINNYMTAKLRLSVTQPIRKNAKTTEQFVRYPLSSERRDTQFLIRAVGDTNSMPRHNNVAYEYKSAPGAEDGDIELLLYQQPIITFHKTPDDSKGQGEFTLHPGWYGRWSSADCYFIREILSRYFAQPRTSRNHLVLSTYNGERYTVKPKESIRFKYDEAARTVTPVSNEVQTTLRLNRKATNNVRARYSEFYRYMKGMIGVRKQTYTDNYYDYKNDEEVVDTYDRIEFTEEEIVAVVPTTNTHSRKLPLRTELRFDQEHPTLTRNPLDKPAISTPTYVLNEITNTWAQVDSREPYDAWLAATQAFLTKVRGQGIDKDNNPLDETESFYQAFVYLAHFTQQGNRRFLGPENFSLDPKQISRAMDEIIFKWHSEEVIEVVPAKEGTVPTAKYLKWVTRDRD